jgi:arginyl-tRNA synthetase
MITLEEVIEDIGVDATRYFLVEKNPDSPIDFDLEIAKKNSMENPVFYIQYAHARICNVFDKLPSVPSTGFAYIATECTPEERQLLFYCNRFQEEIWEAALALAPYRVAQYALGLARAIHAFYEKCPILKAEAKDQQTRILILQHAQKTLRASLDILGISAPQKM